MQRISLTEDQYLYLQHIFDCFQQHSQWPTYRELDRWFIYYHPHLDSEEIWNSLPHGLTNYLDLNQPESRATLTVPAIFLLKNTAHVLRPFLELIKLCADTYMRFPAEKLEMSSERILQENPLWWEIGVRQSGLLLHVEPNIWSSFSGPDQTGHWQCTLARSIRRFRGIATIEDYLEKRDVLRLSASLPLSPTGAQVPKGVSIPSQQVVLHPDIYARCWGLYTQGDYDGAILNATKAIEVEVRKKAQFADDMVGAALIAQAFRGDNPLLEYSQVKAEQEGMMALLRGIILVYKNPQSHRFVGMQDASECLGLLLMCSSLLFTVDAL